MKKSEILREDLQEKFFTAFQNDDISFLQTLYKKLKILNRQLEYFETESVDIADLAENICLASDILLRESGKSVIFCGNDVSPVFGNRQILTKAILEVISFAVLKGDSSLITVKTREFERFVTVEIQSLGEFNFEAQNDGIDFIRNALKKLGAKMFVISQKEYSTTLFSLKKSGNISPFQNKSFIDLVCDRLSPIYIELYGV